MQAFVQTPNRKPPQSAASFGAVQLEKGRLMRPGIMGPIPSCAFTPEDGETIGYPAYGPDILRCGTEVPAIGSAHVTKRQALCKQQVAA
jgi:hypothetical protein